MRRRSGARRAPRRPSSSSRASGISRLAAWVPRSKPGCAARRASTARSAARRMSGSRRRAAGRRAAASSRSKSCSSTSSSSARPASIAQALVLGRADAVLARAQRVGQAGEGRVAAGEAVDRGARGLVRVRGPVQQRLDPHRVRPGDEHPCRAQALLGVAFGEQAPQLRDAVVELAVEAVVDDVDEHRLLAVEVRVEEVVAHSSSRPAPDAAPAPTAPGSVWPWWMM